LNAPLAASRRRARSFLAQSLRLPSETKELARATSPLRPEALTLLSEIMARLHGVDMPVVQFIRASGESMAADIAASFAQASAVSLGRTLLIRLQVPEPPRISFAGDAVAVATIPRRRTRKAAEALEIVPDSAVSGLCHARLGCEYGRASQSIPALPEALLDGAALDFRLIVIESDAPERCPLALDLATRCHGSVLVVAAGVTALPQARRVMRQVQLAGGTLLGSVLHDAPSIPHIRMPSWRRRPRSEAGG
jgi:hypothetical protein